METEVRPQLLGSFPLKHGEFDMEEFYGRVLWSRFWFHVETWGSFLVVAQTGAFVSLSISQQSDQVRGLFSTPCSASHPHGLSKGTALEIVRK